MSWPSTRLRTVTVLKAVTVPRPLKYTRKSPRCAVATITGTTKPPAPAPPRPLAAAPRAAESAAWLEERAPRKYQTPTAITPRIRIQSHQRALERVELRGASTPRAPGSGRSMDLSWPIRSLLLDSTLVQDSLSNAGHSPYSQATPSSDLAAGWEYS